jgi:peptide/nickel transport system substrate-binding protein
VGGYVFPGHELAMTDDEIARELPGYGRDIAANRKEAQRLLKEAGVPEGFKFKLTNRSTDQPYKPVATWLIDQWRQIGLNVEQVVLPTGPFFAEQRKRPPEYDVIMDFNCQTIVNPTVDVSQFTSDDRNDANSGHYIDRKIDEMYDAQLREPDPVKQKQILKQYQIYLATQSYHINTLWWQRTVLSSTNVQAWNVSPSHYINNQLENVWLMQ